MIWIRIGVHLISFVVSFYLIMGLDLTPFVRKGHGNKIQLLYVFLAMALGYLVAQFVLNLSVSY